MAALICERCGAPLPVPGPDALATCTFCGTAARTGDAPPVAAEAQASALVAKERFARELAAFEATFGEAVGGGANADEALEKAAGAFAAVCDPATLANVVRGMVRAFEEAQGVDLRDTPAAIPRLVTSYLGALDDLRDGGAHDLRIPFVAATSKGPLDFEMRVTPARIAELAAAKPKKKKKGLFGRLFG